MSFIFQQGHSLVKKISYFFSAFLLSLFLAVDNASAALAADQADFDAIKAALDGVLTLVKANWITSLVSISLVGIFIAGSMMLYKNIKGGTKST